jgi:hypothetical protein
LLVFFCIAAVKHAQSYALEAERRMGELITIGQETGQVALPGRPGEQINVGGLDIFKTTKLNEVGVTRNQSSRAQFLAARRIGELVPAQERGGKPDRGSKVQTSDIAFPEKQRLSEFRKLAAIPVHDVAVAADAYAKAHRLGLKAENHAMEIRLLAARRIGELVPAVMPDKTGRGKKTVRSSDSFPEKQRLSEFRKLAEIPALYSHNLGLAQYADPAFFCGRDPERDKVNPYHSDKDFKKCVKICDVLGTKNG